MQTIKYLRSAGYYFTITLPYQLPYPLLIKIKHPNFSGMPKRIAPQSVTTARYCG